MASSRRSRSKVITASTKRADIQGLRAIAVVAVIFDHMISWPTGGFVGVDVFFVISGFLITGILLRQHERTGSISFKDFYKKRARRIIPGAVLVLAVTVAAGSVVFFTARAIETATDALYSLFFVANWRFASAGTDYFKANGPVSPLQHYWSLGVEEQFYLVWPVLLFVIFLIGRKRASWTTARTRIVVGITMGILIAVSLAWATFETSSSPNSAYFSTFSRAWELGVGALLAVCATQLEKIPARMRAPLAWLGLAGIVASVFFISDSLPFPSPWAIAPVLSTALVIAAGTGGENSPRYLLPITNPVASWIGATSYSLYLWHFPIIIILGTLVGTSSSSFYIVFAILLTLCFASLSYYFVEQPIHENGWPWSASRKHSRSRSATGSAAGVRSRVVVVAFVIITSLVVSIALMRDSPSSNVAGPAAMPVAESTAGSSATSTGSALLDQRQSKINEALAATTWPNLTPALSSISGLNLPEADADGCAPAAPEGKNCDVTGADPSKLAVVVGNSIAVAWAPAIRAALEPAGWKVVTMTYVGCPFVADDTVNEDPTVTASCPAHKKIVIDEIKKLKPALVLGANVYGTKFSNTAGFSDGTKHWNSSMDQLITEIEPSIGKFVLLSQPPRGGDPNECATRVSVPTDCVFKVDPKLVQFERAEKALMAKPDKRAFVDTHLWFCSTNGLCPAFADGLLMRMDDSHITSETSAALAPLLAEALKLSDPGAVQ